MWRDGVSVMVLTLQDATIAEIVTASELPLSIVIVGVGNADFSAMNILDADDTPLVSRGRRMQRDIVQFVAFRDFDEGRNGAMLAKETLREIPGQVVGYMATRGIRPNLPQFASVDVRAAAGAASPAGAPGAAVGGAGGPAALPLQTQTWTLGNTSSVPGMEPTHAKLLFAARAFAQSIGPLATLGLIALLLLVLKHALSF